MTLRDVVLKHAPDHARQYLTNPPPGSALERAVAEPWRGWYIWLTLYNMYVLTPEERLGRADACLRLLHDMKVWYDPF